MSIRARILIYIENKGISRYKFYKMTGLSNGFLDKEGAVTSDNCEKICAVFPDMNPEWLLIGSGRMIKNNEINAAEMNDSNPTGNKDVNEYLLNKIVELSSENTLLKKENEILKKLDTKKHIPLTEDDVVDGLAAEPSK